MKRLIAKLCGIETAPPQIINTVEMPDDARAAAITGLTAQLRGIEQQIFEKERYAEASTARADRARHEMREFQDAAYGAEKEARALITRKDSLVESLRAMGGTWK